MQYFRLVYSEDKHDRLPEEKSPIVVDSYHLDGFDLRTLWKGKSIDNWNENILLHYSKGEVLLDYVPNNLSWLIFSDKAVSIIRAVETEAQVFPVSISSKTNNEKIQANVVNILTSISAMNWEKSDYLSWEDDPKDIKVIRNLVMNRAEIVNKVDIFRLEEKTNFMIVSERLKREIEKNGLLGFGFWKIEVV